MNKEYLFTNSLNSPYSTVFHSTRQDAPAIQPLIINEFQPNPFLSIGDLLPEFMNTLGGALGSVADNTVGPLVRIGSKKITESFMRDAARKPDTLYLSSHKYERFTSDPVQTVRNMFMGGKWLNTFEIPYYGSFYLNGDYKKQWNVGGIDDISALGAGFGGLLKKFGIDYPGNPRFNVSMNESKNRSVSTTFYLININSTWLKKNFKFIHAIFAGTTWVHLRYCIVRPTNVYNVVCPGRFMFMWATMSVQVSTVGKLRKNAQVAKELSGKVHSIDENTLFPDAWKMTITIDDLTPNNFNMYADYYLNGFNKDEISMQADEKTFGDLAGELWDSVKEIIEMGKKAASEMKDSVGKMAEAAGQQLEKWKDNFKTSGG